MGTEMWGGSDLNTANWAVMLAVTLVVITICLILSVFTPGQDKGLIRVVINTTGVCAWSMWITIYISQFNPLQAPVQPQPGES